MKYVPFKKAVMHFNAPLTLYSLGWLAHLCGLHPQTFRKWQKLKMMPQSAYSRESTGGVFRYFTADELISYSRIINQAPRIPGGQFVSIIDMSRLLFQEKARILLMFKANTQLRVLPNEQKVEMQMRQIIGSK